MATTLRHLTWVLLKYLAWTALGLFVAISSVQYQTWIVLGWTLESTWKLHRQMQKCLLWAHGLLLVPSRFWPANGSQRCTACRAALQQCNKPFQYPALNEGEDKIRLVQIFEVPGSEINCELATFRLDEVPEYIALSYRWTDNDPSYSIIINGNIFHIRPNLHGFLQTMKNENYVGWLFIDAVCINQHDISERSHQVALMRQIYTNATQVVAWLRCESRRPVIDGNEITIQSSPAEIRDTLRKVTEDFVDTPKLKNLPPQAIEMAKDAIENYARMRYAEKWKAVRDTTVWHIFLEDDYWTRLWPVQEILLAKQLTFRCRQVSFDWVDLQILIEELRPEIHGLYDKGRIPPHRAYQHARDDRVFKLGAHKVTMMSELLWRKKNQQRILGEFSTSIPLYEAIIQFAGQKCTDPRDKIFGLLGICQAKLKADYNMPLSEVYLRALTEGLAEIFEEHSANSDNISSAASLQKITTFCWALRYALGLDEMSATVSLITKEILHLFAPPRSMLVDDLSWTGLDLDGVIIRTIQPLLTNDFGAFVWTHIALDKMYYDISRTFFEGRYIWMGKFKEWARASGSGRSFQAYFFATIAEVIFAPWYFASRWPLMIYGAHDSLMPLPGSGEVRKYEEWSKMATGLFEKMMKEGVVPRRLTTLSILEDNQDEIVEVVGGWLAKGVHYFGIGEDGSAKAITPSEDSD